MPLCFIGDGFQTYAVAMENVSISLVDFNGKSSVNMLMSNKLFLKKPYSF
jgi:hypothetical protein